MSNFTNNQLIWLSLVILWIIPWKGVALWRAARHNQKGWFIAILLINTLAVLEIIYLLFFIRKNVGDRKEN